MDPSFVQNLHGLLAQSVAPDTVLIKSATAALNKDYYRNPACIPALFEIVASSPEQNIRQLAAVELRKRVAQRDGELWIKAPQDVRLTIKSRITDVLLAEQISIVRHAIARVLATVAEHELPLKQWDALLPWIFHCTTSTTVVHREIGSYVIYTILESVVDILDQHTSQLIQLFSKLLQDQESSEVRITTLRAVGTLAQYIDAADKDEIRQFHALIPLMITVLGQVIEAKNEEGARHGFDVFETLLILETPLLSKSIPNIVEFFLLCGSNRNIDDDIRVMALNALTWTVKYKRSKVQSLNLAKPILEQLLPIGAEADPTDTDEDSPSRIALRIIDTLATALPPNQVFPPLLNLVQSYMQSPDPNNRKSAMMAFGVAIEGCSEFIRPHMASLWPLIDAGFNDSSAIVRKAACISFGCVCEWLEEECVERHSVIIPIILNLINDPESQESACTALDSFLEILGETIQQYLVLIMERLASLLETANLKVKSLVTGAIGSAAHASKEHFKPYFAQTMLRLHPFLLYRNEGEELELRGITMDAVGTMAEAVGKEDFQPYFSDMMKVAFDGVVLNSARLRECSFLFFGVMARVFEDEFAPYLSEVVPALLQSCKQSEAGDGALQNDSDFNTGESAAKAINVMDKGSDVEIEVGGADEPALTVNSAIAVEKEIAADTIGTVFASTRAHFLPFLHQSTTELIDLLQHYYEGIRKAALTSLLEFVRTYYELSDPQPWEPGLQVSVPLHQNVKDLVQHVLPQLITLWELEDDKSTCSTLCQALAETISKLGPAFVEGRLDEICTYTVQILEQKAMCQQDPDQDDEEEVSGEESAEFDAVLISTAGDLVSSLAAVLGSDFAPAFKTFLPLIAKYYSKNRTLNERSSTIGCLGEIVAGMKSGITPFTETLFNILYTALSDPEPEVRSNAAFGVGVLVENTDMDLSGQYLQLLSGLRPFFDVTPESPDAALNARDNAAGAVARLILKNTSSIPLEQVIPVFVASLPLKNDFLENRAVFLCLFHLFRNNQAIVVPHLDHLLRVFAHVLDPAMPDQLVDEQRAELIALLKHLNEQFPQQINAAGLGVFVAS